jgi:hypothetical protein
VWDRLRHSAFRGALLALVTGFGWAPAYADILHLRDGSRHYGELISEGRREITFRIVAPGGASMVRKFALDRVASVERTAEKAPPENKAEGGSPAGGLAERDFEQILREAYELLDDGDQQAAQRALQRLVQLAPHDTLAELDAQCKQQRGRSIGELLAAARLEAALKETGTGHPFRLRGVTRIEGEALGMLLEQHENALLDKLYDARSIREWAMGVAPYDRLRADSRRLVFDARLAASILAARLRYDTRLAGATDDRKRLADLRAAVTRFAAGVMALPGYTAAPVDDEETREWLRRHVGKGGTLLRSLGSPATQPAATQPSSAPGDNRKPRPRLQFPEDDDP